jgi:hypothetical protein
VKPWRRVRDLLGGICGLGGFEPARVRDAEHDVTVKG